MELSIRGVNVSLDELRLDVQAAKEKGLAGQYAFMPETVEALLDLIDTLTPKCSQVDIGQRLPKYSLEDIEKRFDAVYRAQLRQPALQDKPDSSRMEAAWLAALHTLESEGLVKHEDTYDWRIWHYVPTEGPSVPRHRSRI